MTSVGSPEFWELYRALPEQVKRDARTAYRRFEENPSHPSLRLEQINTRFGWLYSVRVNARYRVLLQKISTEYDGCACLLSVQLKLLLQTG